MDDGYVACTAEDGQLLVTMRDDMSALNVLVLEMVEKSGETMSMINSLNAKIDELLEMAEKIQARVTL